MSVPNTSELDDEQIEALIRKLSAIKGSAPELIAALEAEANSRLAKQSGRRGGKDRGRGGNRGGDNNRRGRSHSYEEEEPDEDEYDDDYDDEEEEDEEEDEEDDDEETDSEEEDDEFDEDGPCVGYGYSDEVSVISEMTTPTVVSNLHVPAEERYDEIHHGYGAATKKSNKPDLLSQVNRANAAKNRGNNSQSTHASRNSAASNQGLNSEKRKAYTSGLSAMAKISETAEAAAVTKPKTAASGPRGNKKGPARKNSNDGGGGGGGRSGGKPSSSRGLRRDNSPARGKKKPTGGKRSNHSAGSGSGKGGSKQTATTAAASNDAFSDDWHKSLTAGEFNANSTDDNGFPFSFGDTENAFASSSNSFFNKKAGGGDGGGGGGGDTTDPFDPFATTNGDPFAEAAQSSSRSKKKGGGGGGGSDDGFGDSNAFGNSTGSGTGRNVKSTKSRPRRSSGVDKGKSRSKGDRDQSPRRKKG